MATNSKSEFTSLKPKIFIGSSVEGLPVASLFYDGLRHTADPTLWSQPGMFGPSEFTLESLEAALDKFPYALIVLTPDDILHSRGLQESTARDNVIFELGLFVGRHGRRSVFVAVPDATELRVPSDIMGLTPVKYAATGFDGFPRYDVRAACTEILRTLQSRPPAKEKQPITPRSSPFWDVLSDTIVILYGVEPDVGGQKHPRHRVSLRDLDTAWELKAFLERRYPTKRVWPVPTTALGWERLMQTGADLVVVGGFGTNTEFAKHRSDYEHFFRLRMGRLCIVEGQRVHVPSFAPPNGSQSPDRYNPQAVEDFGTEYTTRDFGLVFNGLLHIYGRERRVVAIAGVKGHGTRGAALFLCDDRNGVDTRLAGFPLAGGETLELAIAADVVADVVDRIEPMRILLNGVPLFERALEDSEPCELGRSCTGCDFGILQTIQEPTTRRRIVAAQIRAIVFDLDDTLLDTFNALIVPLEVQAARAMIAAGTNDLDASMLASTLLRLRRQNPANLEDELMRLPSGLSRKALAARKRLLTKVSLENLLLSPEITQLLKRLRNQFELYLLTAGAKRFQNRKIDRLDIRRLFIEVLVVDNSAATTKMAAIKTLADRRGFRYENVLVVGNRLDSEIAAGNALGMPTVWVRQGEGSELKPGISTGQPDITLVNVLEIASLLGA